MSHKTVTTSGGKPDAYYEPDSCGGPTQDERLYANIAGSTQGVSGEFVRRQLGHFTRVDPVCGSDIARALGIQIESDAA